MTKQNFIALADEMRVLRRELSTLYGANSTAIEAFDSVTIPRLAAFCKSQNSAFKRERWIDYINGDCGPNGGAVKGGK